eukprot:TRINITY_DN10644_c4_g5_i1.p1 TRINITY_DN10644_c4_g5~~TRINITY_DN10644_c4_g5_i1.p1  ORF type:complete len:393 (-),score=69.59 TRINITY_DN10644_c4_g5_i1:75-1253(-)
MAHILVLGAGPAGISAAALLRQLKLPNLKVSVWEQHSREAWKARRSFPVGLWAGACRVLRRLGVDCGEAGSVPCRVVPGGCYTNTSGKVLAAASAQSLASSGGSAGAALRFFSRESDLLEAIAASQDVEISFEENYRADQSLETFEKADLIIDARGCSKERSKLHQEPRTTQLRGYTVYRGVSQAPLREVFPSLAFQCWGPSRRFAAIPLLEGSAWYATLADDHTLTLPKEDLNVSGLVGELKDAFRGWHDPIEELLEGTVKAEGELAVGSSFPWSPILRGSSRKIALGDAAYVFDPILAVGAGEAIREAEVLVDLLSSRLDAVSDTKVLDAIREELAQQRLREMQKLASFSNLAQLLGQTNWCRTRDTAASISPSFVKTAIFDWSVRQLAK